MESCVSMRERPPCERCGGPRGAHAMGCPAPAIDRAVRSLTSLAKVSDAVLDDAVAALHPKVREKFKRMLSRHE